MKISFFENNNNFNYERFITEIAIFLSVLQ